MAVVNGFCLSAFGRKRFEKESLRVVEVLRYGLRPWRMRIVASPAASDAAIVGLRTLVFRFARARQSHAVSSMASIDVVAP